jgi:hypothetical protein
MQRVQTVADSLKKSKFFEEIARRSPLKDDPESLTHGFRIKNEIRRRRAEASELPHCFITLHASTLINTDTGK